MPQRQINKTVSNLHNNSLGESLDSIIPPIVELRKLGRRRFSNLLKVMQISGWLQSNPGGSAPEFKFLIPTLCYFSHPSLSFSSLARVIA